MPQIAKALAAHGLVTECQEFCKQCGVEFTCEAFFVKAMDKKYPMHEFCPEHRNYAFKTMPEKQKPRPHVQDEIAWKKICPPKFLNADEKRFNAKLKDVLSYRYNPQGLFLQGGTGTQKSFASFWLMERMFYRGHSVKLFAPSVFFDQCLSSFTDGTHERWKENIIHADCVLFDDLGQEKFTDRTTSDFFAIVDGRLNYNKPTFYTCNFPSELLLGQLPAHNGKQIIRRILDGCKLIQTGDSNILQTLPF